jgi:DNA polymerase-1
MRVNPVGPTDADIMLVGEAPGKKEDKEGVPFVGASGNLLDTLLNQARISRRHCYITNVVKERPPGNNFKRKYYKNNAPTPELKEAWQALKTEIRRIKPNVIVVLGNEALYALTGKYGITSWRGSILETSYGKVLPTIHPAAILRKWSYFPLSLSDFQKIAEESRTKDLIRDPYNLVVQPTMIDVLRAFEHIYDEGLVTFDIEAPKKARMIDCMSFCGDGKTSICVPFTKTKGKSKVIPTPYWSELQEVKVWKMIADLLADPQVGKIAQNANFDVAYMEAYGCPTTNMYMDTMNAHHTVYPELPRGLDTMQSIYTKLPYHKDSIDSDRWKYNALDSLGTHRVAMQLDKELKDFGLYEFYHDFIKKAVVYYRDVARQGVKIDTEKRNELREVYADRLEKTQQEINEAVTTNKVYDTSKKGVVLNPNSSQQLQEYFYKDKGYYVYKHKGRPTTREKALESLARKYPSDPMPELVLKARGLQKVLSNYVNAPIDPDLRMRTTYIVSGTVTGRLASRKTVSGTGTNLQNIQHGDPRAMFIPDHPDWMFTEADLAGADARIVAYISGDPNLIRVFETGADYHSTNTAMLYDIAVPNPDHIEKYDVPQDIRKQSKPISHGANYGRSYRSIALELRISETEAKQKMNRYFDLYPGIVAWHRDVRNELRRTGTLVTPFGRKRQFFESRRRGDFSNNLLNQAYAYVPQATIGDLTHKGFVNMYETLQKRSKHFPARIALNMHDSLIVAHHKDVKEEIDALMKNAMEIPFVCGDHEIVIPVDFSDGINWKEV